MASLVQMLEYVQSIIRLNRIDQSNAALLGRPVEPMNNTRQHIEQGSIRCPLVA